VISWEGTIINEGLMLLHAGIEGNIVILAPTTKRVKEKDWVLVASLHELFTGVLEEETVAIMEWVADLEAVDCVSTTLLHLLVDFTGEKSVLVKTIVELDALEEAGALSRDEPVTLLHNGLGLGVFG